jgi:hypothetical protein
MDIKILKKISTAALIFFTCIQSTCKKDGACIESKYSFEINVKAVPNSDSINVNDTIWLVLDESINLLDRTTNSSVNYDNAANLGSAIGFQKAIFFPSLDFIPSAAKFNFILIDGQETSNANATLFREYLFSENSNKYKFRLGVIPKDTGIYRFVFSNAANVYRKNDNCTKASFEINFKQTNQHRYLIPGFGNNTSKGGDYYFKVK